MSFTPVLLELLAHRYLDFHTESRELVLYLKDKLGSTETEVERQEAELGLLKRELAAELAKKAPLN